MKIQKILKKDKDPKSKIRYEETVKLAPIAWSLFKDINTDKKWCPLYSELIRRRLEKFKSVESPRYPIFFQIYPI